MTYRRDSNFGIKLDIDAELRAIRTDRPFNLKGFNIRKSRLLVDEFAFDLNKLKPQRSLPTFIEKLDQLTSDKGNPKVLPKVNRSRVDVLALTNRIE